MALPYDEAGSGPALVLLHAGIADRTMWSEHLAPLAAAGYRVVAPDLPGFGQAHVRAGPQAPWNDVLELLRALDVDRAVIVGNSFGGAVALRVAVVAPAAASALVLISAPGPEMEPSPRLQAAWEAEETALDQGDLEGAVDAVVAAWTLADAPESLRERVAVMQRRALVLQAEAPEVSEAPDPVEDRPEALAHIELPALLVAGEHDMPDFLDAAESLAQTLPNARHEVIAGAGHLAPLETPDAFRELLLDFLARAS